VLLSPPAGRYAPENPGEINSPEQRDQNDLPDFKHSSKQKAKENSSQ